MTTIRLTRTTCLAAHCAATIGFFDGVHRGHLFLLEQLKQLAAGQGLQSMVVTFDRHPRQVVQPDWQPLLLSTLEEKEQLLAQTGIDTLVVLPFDEQMAALSAFAFMRQVLKAQLGVDLLLTGYDNHFGHRQGNIAEGFDDYADYGSKLGIDVVCGQPLIEAGTTVSSSYIRQLLGEGRVKEAARCLGRSYELQGTVEHGRQQGRKMGFPTANLALQRTDCVVPRRGLYVVRAEACGKTWKGMTNIGMRPTFNGHRQTIETHLLDFSGDLYGQPLRIAFMERLRDERRFDSPDELARQMALDAQRCREIEC